LNTKQLMYLHR